MVGSHDEYTALLRSNTIKNVEKTRQREAARKCRGTCRRSTGLAGSGRDRNCSLCCAFYLGRFTSVCKASTVDVLQEHYTATREFGEKSCQVLLSSHDRAQTDHVDTHTEETSQSKTERTLSSTRGAIEKVPTAIGDTTVRVPAASVRVQIICYILNQLLLGLFVEDDRRDRTTGSTHATLPRWFTPVCPHGATVDDSLFLILLQVLILSVEEELLDDAWVATETRDGKFLAGTRREEATVSVFVTFEEKHLTLVPEEVGSDRGGVLERLLAGTASAFVIIILIIPTEEEPASGGNVGVDHKAARALSELLIGDPCHDYVVNFIISFDANAGHKVPSHDIPRILCDVVPDKDNP